MQNGHVGFLLSCYDAELSYDPQTDTFKAKYETELWLCSINLLDYFESPVKSMN